jgi:hypothetical protein
MWMVEWPTLLKRILLVLAVLIALPYARTQVYRFPEPTVFSGAHFLNPYEKASGRWLRANFHAHGEAWNGITYGEQTNDEVIAAYRRRGYDIATISNYQRIAAHEGVDTLPAYEHGYSLGKRHQLAIGAHAVEWLDYPLFQSLSHKQQIINLVKQKADLVALAHPNSRDAYTSRDLQQLTGYQLIEVVNGPFPVEETWDAALSAGRLVWGLANDDSHDINDPRRMASAWTMVNARTSGVAEIVSALADGRHYAVRRPDVDDPAAEDTDLESVAFADGRLTIHCGGAPATFMFVGQGGAVRKTIYNNLTAEYTFTPQDTYVRGVVYAPRRVIYLNPIVRYDGAHVPAPAATVDWPGTWLLRTAIVLGTALLVALGWRRRLPSPTYEPERSLREITRKPA